MPEIPLRVAPNQVGGRNPKVPVVPAQRRARAVARPDRPEHVARSLDVGPVAVAAEEDLAVPERAKRPQHTDPERTLREPVDGLVLRPDRLQLEPDRLTTRPLSVVQVRSGAPVPALLLTESGPVASPGIDACKPAERKPRGPTSMEARTQSQGRLVRTARDRGRRAALAEVVRLTGESAGPVVERDLQFCGPELRREIDCQVAARRPERTRCPALVDRRAVDGIDP